MMLKILLVGLGGFFGSVCRYLVSGWAQGLAPFSSFPWGTLTVNLLGCLVLGLAAGLAEARGVLSPHARLLLMMGFLGGFTTFSTFGLESYSLLQDGTWGRLAGNLLASVLGGLTAVWVGEALARALS
jgi:CrcB protein